MFAKNIMRDIQVLSTDVSLDEASQIFDAHSLEFVAVRNPGAVTHGILSAKALLKALIVAKTDPTRVKIAHHLELLTEPVFISEDEKLPLILKSLLASPSEVVIVSSGTKKFAGLISHADLFFVFRGQDKKPEDAFSQLKRIESECGRLAHEIQQARASEQTYKDLFRRSPYMLHAVDGDGRIVLANPMIHQILSYQEGHLVGRSVYDIYPQNIHTQISSGLKRLQTFGHHELVHSSMVKKSGELVRVNLVSSSILDSEGKFLHTLTVSRTENIEEMKPLGSPNARTA